MIEIQSRMDGVLKRFIGRGAVGASAAVLVPGRPVVTAVAGLADVSSGKRVDRSHLFKIASCTKTFVAATLVRLASTGEFSLDDPVTRWFPQLPALKNLTVKHLINHRSGLPDYERDLPMGSDESWTPDEIVEFAFDVGLRSVPDQIVSYSNTGYVLAGSLIEQLTGTTLAEQVREKIISPLLLSDTYSLLETDCPRDRLVRGYFSYPEPSRATTSSLANGTDMWNMHAVLDHSPQLQDASDLFSPSCLYAAGDMVSTATDLVRFLDGLFAAQLVDSCAMTALAGDRWPVSLPGTRKRQSAAGLFISCYGERELIGHQGSVPGYVSLMQHDVETGISYALLTNTGANNRLSFYASGLHNVMDQLVVAST